jgi:hypothetical protein
MSLDLSIHLDGGATSLTASQEVTGRVDVRSSTGGEVRRVALAVGWRTEGGGNRAAGSSHELVLADSPISFSRGETRSLPFRFVAPAGPLSYEGTHLRIINTIGATADVRWARDPSAELVYDLRRARDQAAAFQGPRLSSDRAATGPARVRARPRRAELLLAIAAVLAGIGLGVGASVAGASPPLLTALVVIAGVSVAAALMLPFRSRLAEGRLGRVELVFDRAVAAPGGTIRVAFTFRPRSDLRIQSAVATLRGHERVIRGHGKNRVVRRHAFTHTEARLAGERNASKGEPVALWGQLVLAPDCPCSFAARDNSLTWEAEVRIAIAGWPDWVATYPVLVWPATPAPTSDRD